MIEPVRHGQDLVDEIATTQPSAGSLAIWWLGQSGYLIKSLTGLIAIDLYLSEHLTQKYQATSRPHVRMTRAPVRGHALDRVDLILASHKHSDHLDPGTLPDLMAASPGAVARGSGVDHQSCSFTWVIARQAGGCQCGWHCGIIGVSCSCRPLGP